MKYFLDTEFLEGTQKSLFGKNKPTIDLISIGIVSDDNRKFYAVSKEFNLKEAWNRWQQRTGEGDRNNIEPRLYWIRENVLRPIFNEWKMETNGKIVRLGLPISLNEMEFNYKNFKYCIKCIGQTNSQIAFGVVNFVHGYKDMGNWIWTTDEYYNTIMSTSPKELPTFYGYYSDYDWVVFCWLFGKMVDLPKGFPNYCIDLKQILDEKAKSIPYGYTKELGLKSIKMDANYPKQTNEHNALSDAIWNKQLYEFLQTIKQ
jgi:3' exoribonuclease, RNase T-like